ncbi:DUF6281 family protein [Streptomyces sp. NPDC001102]
MTSVPWPGRTVWRRTFLAAALATLSTACTSGSDGESASSCASRVEYREHTYMGSGAEGFTIGERLGAATLPPCDDTPSDDSDAPTAPASVTAFAIKGVDPSIAIALDDSPDDVIFVNVDSGEKLPDIKEMIRGS